MTENAAAPDTTDSNAPAEETSGSSGPGDDVVTEIEVEVPEGHVVVVGPDGEPLGTVPATVIQQAAEEAEGDERGVTDLVEQPAKVMRIGSMIRQLLEEVKAAPLDEASRARLRDIHQASIKELETGLAPELIEELERIALPFTDDATPSEGELRIAQAQLVGWLEGLFHGIQTALYAQQVASRAQFEQIRKALPGVQLGHDEQSDNPGLGQDSGHQSGGMYL